MPLALFLSCVITFIIYIKYRFKDDSRFLIVIFFVAMIVRMIVATGIYVYSTENGGGGYFSGDESVYYKRAINIIVSSNINSENNFSDTPELDSPKFALNLFSILEAIWMFNFGQSLLLVRYINSFIGAVLPISIFLLTKIIFNNKTVAKITSLLVAFLPSLIGWSAVGLKEPLIMLLIVNIFYLYIKNQDKFKIFYFCNFIILNLLLFYLQKNIFVIFIITYSISLIFIMLSKFVNKAIILLIFVLIMSHAFLTNQTIIKHKLYEIAEHQILQHKAGDYKSSRYLLYPYKTHKIHYFDFYNHLVVPSEIYSNIDIKQNTDVIKSNIDRVKWTSFILSYCKGLIYAIFSPFIWSINSGMQLIVYPQVVIWWGIIPFIFYGIIWSVKFKRNKTALILLFIGGVYSVLSISEGNIGSVFRHRDWVTPLCLMFGTAGASNYFLKFAK